MGNKLYPAMPEARENDWRNRHREVEQRVEEMRNAELPAGRPLCVLPLHLQVGPTVVPQMERYMRAFFPGARVLLMDPLVLRSRDDEDEENARTLRVAGGEDLPGVSCRHRDGCLQILTGDVMALLGRLRPPEAFCVVAVTSLDLYPRSSWRFVFGQANFEERTGVFSMSRFTDEAGPPVELRRSLKVMSHETLHMFGVRHCRASLCLMNGSNHLRELDQSPMHLCVTCQQKLAILLHPLDKQKRYANLREFYHCSGLHQEAHWVDMRLALFE